MLVAQDKIREIFTDIQNMPAFYVKIASLLMFSKLWRVAKAKIHSDCSSKV